MTKIGSCQNKKQRGCFKLSGDVSFAVAFSRKIHMLPGMDYYKDNYYKASHSNHLERYIETCVVTCCIELGVFH